MSSYGTPGAYQPQIAVGEGAVPPVPFSQPKNLFRYGEQTLWSTQLLSSSAAAPLAVANATFRLFTTPLGQNGQGFANALTISETNLKEGGRIPAGISYDAFGIAAIVGMSTGQLDAGTLNQTMDNQAQIQQLLNIVQNGVLSWDFTQTQVDIAPIGLIGAGGGAYGAVGQNAAAANSGHMNNGAGSVWLYRKHPVALPGTTTFSILMRFGSRAAVLLGTNSMFVKVVLLGYYKNVIEIG